jgi:hypothetical protein
LVSGMATEAVVRNALRVRVLTAINRACETVDELWVPRSHERADLAVIGQSMDGFEIKTERDTLRRLPRQIDAYGRLFDRCSVVVAQKHHDQAAQMLPVWWGITTAHVNGGVSFTEIRQPQRNPSIDPEILVRLLWKEEATIALMKLGAPPDEGASRGVLWRALLEAASLSQLRSAVRRALLNRDPARARIATRRFTAAATTQAAR